MGHSESKQQLIGPARRRAFETYLRFGRWPEEGSRDAERKAINPAVPLPALPKYPTRFYVWRTVGDHRVRPSHAARESKVFARSEPPHGGHPGSERGCRCWAEPYYGDPNVPDALQPLRHDEQVDRTGRQHWASIETLTRPDGSLAQSVVVNHDGTQVSSRFAGSLIARTIMLAGGDIVRLDQQSGVQSVYLGNDSQPLFQSAWTARGPRVTRARQHVAFLGDDDTQIDPDIAPDPLAPPPEPSTALILPNLSGLIALALVAVYAAQQAAPASQGLGEDDEPVIVVKTWSLDLLDSTPVMVDAQTDVRLQETCRHREVIEAWAAEAMAAASAFEGVQSPQTRGIRAHTLLKEKVEYMSQKFPALYGNLKAEISFVDGNENEVPYGTKGSSRLDIFEDRLADMGAVCVYDLKTGLAGLTFNRVARIGRLTLRIFKQAAMVYITQVGPTIDRSSAR